MKNLLVLNFFPAFTPPASGGELRYYHVYKQLSEYFRITLLSPTYSHHRAEFTVHSPTFREYRVPKEDIHDRLHWQIDQENIGIEYSALVCALSDKYPNEYHRAYLQLYSEADVIIHESPYMLGYDLFFGLDAKPRIYNSYNHEARLVRQMWSGPHAHKYAEYINALEKRLAENCDLLFAISPEEMSSFLEDFDVPEEKLKPAPNGIDCTGTVERRSAPASAGRPTALFIGSKHPPNVEAARFILSALGGQCPEIDFLVAGSCCEDLKDFHKPENVRLLGRVSEEEKLALFRDCTVGINPMFSGAGTNLKTLEFLAQEIPMISTPVGARGLGMVDGEHFILAEKDEFASRLRSCLGNDVLLQKLASAGAAFVNAHFSWERIAREMSENIERLEPKNRRSLLVLNDFEVSCPMAGGQTRIHRLYSHLSRYYKITLFCFNEEGLLKKTWLTDSFAEISFPKLPAHIDELARQNARFHISVSDIVNARLCAANPLLVEATGCARSFVDAIVLVHPYMQRMVEEDHSIPTIYESLNFEYGLKRSLLKGHPAYAEHTQLVDDVERKAFTESMAVFAVSEDDANAMADRYAPSREVFLLPNGVDVRGPAFFNRSYSAVKSQFHGHPVVVFIGSAHKPNIDAVRYILDELSRKVGNAYFVVIGNVCEAICDPLPSNVVFLGSLDEESKDIVLSIADAAVNPIFEGSGSNLKLAEYFACKLPTVTTPFGARGYAIGHGKEAMIAEASDFAGALDEVLTNPTLRGRLKENAYHYVTRHHDWRGLADTYRNTLTTALPGGRKRLLVVTYRFTDPPLGGAEWYLYHLIEELEKLGDFSIDIATLDIERIGNQLHFSTWTSPLDAWKYTAPGPHLLVRRFPVNQLPLEDLQSDCRALFRLWYDETIQVSLRYPDLYDRPILLGGWNFPEELDEERTQIWSSERSLIHVGGAERLSVAGFAPTRCSLTASADGEIVYREAVKGSFTLDLTLRENRIVELLVEPGKADGNDPRTLGILVSAIRTLKAGRESELPLNACYRDFLKERHLEAYIDALMENTLRREPDEENRFQRVRGPASTQLETWLDANISNYDVVLGHGVPFSTSVLAARYATKWRRPLVILPHYHFDDAYYHWRAYYEAMQKAAAVLAFPRQSIPLFYDKLGISTLEVPGGGLLKEEFEGGSSEHFLRVYSPERPFFLVLGRKAGAKNYRWAIEAAQQVNAGGRLCDLVLIGPDEDDRAVAPEEAAYLGEQPREVVLAALRECVAVINMSDSESFGMVLPEAWMLKKPVIANRNCRAFGELVEHGVNGLLVDRAELPLAMLDLLQAPHKAEAMGESGFTRMGMQFHWTTIARQVNDLLLKLSGGTVDVSSAVKP